MAETHAAFGQPSSLHGISFSPVALGMVRLCGESHSMGSTARMIAEQSHAPPIPCSQAARPLRI